MTMERYPTGKFIYMSKDMEEKVSNMNEEELDILSSYLAYSINKTTREINNDILKRSGP
jgi:hypothetical protein